MNAISMTRFRTNRHEYTETRMSMRCSRRVRCQVRVDTSRALFGLALETFHQQIPRSEFAKWFSHRPHLFTSLLPILLLLRLISTLLSRKQYRNTIQFHLLYKHLFIASYRQLSRLLAESSDLCNFASFSHSHFP
jgi:hypothetical protein